MKTEFPQAELDHADILYRMKSLAVLFAGEITGYGLDPFAGGTSAFECSVKWASKLPDITGIKIFITDKPQINDKLSRFEHYNDVPVHWIMCSEADWTMSSFFARFSTESEGFDHVFFSWADCPFLDLTLTDTLLKMHLRYAAEYTFADGYPYGFSPDILAQGIVPVLAVLARENTSPVIRNCIFETIKKDINSFDIETDIAPVDLRQLRLNLSCDTRRNTLLCKSLKSINAQNYGEIVHEKALVLRTLPAYYAIQVAGKCPFECLYCPYPAFCRSGKGTSPGKPATERIDEMTLGDFRIIIDKIAAFSEDAVVCLSLWGESSYHSNIAALVEIVLSYPKLAVLIETTGIAWKNGVIEAIAEILSRTNTTPNAAHRINWIVSLDAVGSACYGKVHGIPETVEGTKASEVFLREALAFTEKLAPLFPGAVWPQMMRLNESEVELESFYRFWKQTYGQVIVQKHDHFCRSIEDRRVADLSPLVRNPCWHLKRDMCIMMDGTVPLCREDIYATRSTGNAITDDLSLIWAGQKSTYEQHTLSNYEGMCGACDEYYTYNF